MSERELATIEREAHEAEGEDSLAPYTLALVYRVRELEREASERTALFVKVLDTTAKRDDARAQLGLALDGTAEAVRLLGDYATAVEEQAVDVRPGVTPEVIRSTAATVKLRDDLLSGCVRDWLSLDV